MGLLVFERLVLTRNLGIPFNDLLKDVEQRNVDLVDFVLE
jgi:hypothetical protein